MSSQTDLLKQHATTIKNEVADGANTANRVGGAILEAANILETHETSIEEQRAELNKKALQADLTKEVERAKAEEKKNADNIATLGSEVSGISLFDGNVDYSSGGYNRNIVDKSVNIKGEGSLTVVNSTGYTLNIRLYKDASSFDEFTFSNSSTPISRSINGNYIRIWAFFQSSYQPSGALSINVSQGLASEIRKKANKPESFLVNRLAAFDENGNLKDSGFSTSAMGFINKKNALYSRNIEISVLVSGIAWTGGHIVFGNGDYGYNIQAGSSSIEGGWSGFVYVILDLGTNTFKICNATVVDTNDTRVFVVAAFQNAPANPFLEPLIPTKYNGKYIGNKNGSDIASNNEASIIGLPNSVDGVASVTGMLTESYNYNLLQFYSKAGVTLYFDVTVPRDKWCNFVVSYVDGTTANLFGFNGNKNNAHLTPTKDVAGFGLYYGSADNFEYTIKVSKEAALIDVPSAKKNINIMFLGDSITADNYYRPILTSMLKPAHIDNLAVVSATWADRPTTTGYDGDPKTSVSSGNVLGNQVQKILNNPSTYNVVPDIIFIAAGINDIIPSASEAEYSNIESYFTSESNVAVPCTAPTFDGSDTYKDSRKKITGAMRYVCSKLMQLYPNAKILISTPLQTSINQNQRYDKSIRIKQQIIAETAHRLGLEVIHTGEECGINQDFEYGGAFWNSSWATSARPYNGRDLIDGLHPNDNGCQKMAKYIYNHLLHICAL